ncbi:FadR/GntR family transcriptional regulator [Kineosporia succinea]|uniref:GntR family transcriptional repressor for pyruvate dehydrogenase complex n=1 Tax=Kineosporia succinea TaxID=84632 RepID=A0ABT9P9C6_9ACTN|nr:FadR/GntR family transcriptional regulator [Kineosporia succinea]MDP9829297.1 GntR family transcriptional repressor for pyruvate dehydrogenase complex [Kineosporia succinea]
MVDNSRGLDSAFGGTIKSSTAMAEVTRRLLDYIASGSLAEGDRLPPERQLATHMGVGRSAVREALAALEILGIVTVRPGSGTYLSGGTSELLPQTLSWGILLHSDKTRELIEVRQGLETQAALLAATRISDTSLTALREHTETMENSLGDYHRFVTADMLFHHELASGADNVLLRDTLQSVRSLIRVWVERALNDDDHARLTLAEHRAILAGLEAHDPIAAAEAMRRHMTSATERLLPTLDDESR